MAAMLLGEDTLPYGAAPKRTRDIALRAIVPGWRRLTDNESSVCWRWRSTSAGAYTGLRTTSAAIVRASAMRSARVSTETDELSDAALPDNSAPRDSIWRAMSVALRVLVPFVMTSAAREATPAR